MYTPTKIEQNPKLGTIRLGLLTFRCYFFEIAIALSVAFIIGLY